MYVYIRSLPLIIIFITGEMKLKNYNSMPHQGSILILNEGGIRRSLYCSIQRRKLYHSFELRTLTDTFFPFVAGELCTIFLKYVSHLAPLFSLSIAVNVDGVNTSGKWSNQVRPKIFTIYLHLSLVT